MSWSLMKKHSTTSNVLMFRQVSWELAPSHFMLSFYLSSADMKRLETDSLKPHSGISMSQLHPTISGKPQRSEEHTSELQSRGHLVCRLLLEKKKNKYFIYEDNTHHSKAQ